LENESALSITLETIKNIISEGYLLTDLNGVIVDCNETFANYLGTNLDNLIGSNIQDFLSDSEFLFSSKFFEELSSRKKLAHEVSLKANDIIKAVIFNIASLYDKSNNPIKILFIIQEVPSNLSSKDSTSEYNLVNVFDMFLNAILIIDFSNRIIFTNNKAEELFKVNCKALIEKNITEILPGIENFLSFDTAPTDEERKSQLIETNFNLPNGDQRYLCVRSFPMLEGSILILSDQTNRRQFEQRLKDSEEKFRSIVENAQEGIWIIDAESKTSFVNQYMADMLGFSGDEMLGKSLLGFIDEEDIKLANFYLARCQQGIKETHNFEFLRKDETKVYANLKITPIFNENGGYEGAFAFISDITEKRLIELRLKESEERYRLIIENVNDLIFILNSRYEYEFINEKTLLRTLEYDKEDLIGKNGLEFVHPDDKTRAIEKLTEGFKRGEGIAEVRVRKKDGTYAFLEAKGQIFIDKNGESKAVVISRDITERKKIEDNLKDSEKKYRILFEKIPIAITLLDKSGGIIDCNKAIEELVGYSKEEILQKHFEELMTLYPKDFPKLMGQYERLVKGLEVEPFDLVITTKDGEKRWVNILVSILTQESGITGFQIIANDITARKIAEETLKNLMEEIKQQNQKLKELDKAKDEMLEIISHELRTPLVSILGFVDLLSTNDSNLTEEQKDHMKILKRNTQRLNQLVENILDTDKLEMGKTILNIKSFDFQKLINSALKELYYRIKQKMHKINIDIPPNFKIQADEELIHQVISNLLTNAIKYTPDRGTISIKVKKQGLKILFSIKDTGIGINQEDIPKLFQKFQRLPYQEERHIGDVKGIGLGLYFSKKIIELHGGKMWVESVGINQGSTFYFEIPIQS